MQYDVKVRWPAWMFSLVETSGFRSERPPTVIRRFAPWINRVSKLPGLRT
jgi:hypothetical protein